MELQQIESFVEVAKQQNFSKAAEKLHITQPTMSARIQKLENELGVPLFHRLGKVIRLSKYGEAFLPYAQKCIETMDLGVKKIVEEKNRTLSKLTVCSAIPFGTIIFPYILPSLYEFDQEVQIQVLRNTEFSNDIVKMVVEAKIDIGFFEGREYLDTSVDLDEVDFVPLYENDFVLLARPSHRIAKCQQISASELAEHWFVLSEESEPISKHIQHYFDQHEIRPAWTMPVNSFLSIKEMVKKTDMLTILPRLIAKKDIKSGELVELSLTPCPRPLVTYLAHSRNYDAPRVLKVIKNRLETIIDELDLPCRIIRS
ncbi:LysR family transcriptional regulator [Brevibacillus reuszeri]|uniref:LysR family transcriptional regulator n=1 Tax=Brevibacillus reuszeri TaxID=54915 RepID=UPI0013DE8D41|nr:LysR family transcriptional regulator [Brevibacillus reuszeri]